MATDDDDGGDDEGDGRSRVTCYTSKFTAKVQQQKFTAKVHSKKFTAKVLRERERERERERGPPGPPGDPERTGKVSLKAPGSLHKRRLEPQGKA